MGDRHDRCKIERNRTGIAGVVIGHGRGSLGDRPLQFLWFGRLWEADLDKRSTPDPVHLIVVDPVATVDDDLVARPVGVGKPPDLLGVGPGDARRRRERHTGR